MGINDTIRDFEKYLIEQGKSDNTIKNYTRYTEHLLYYFKNINLSIENVSIRDLEKYLSTLKVSVRSKNAIKCVIKSFYNHLVKSERVKENIAELLTNSKTKEYHPEVLSKDEIKKCFEYINKTKNALLNRTLFAVGIYTGMRLSEILSLRIENIFYENGYAKTTVLGKGNKERIVVFHKEAERLIKLLIKDRKNGYVFKGIYRGNKPLSREYFQKLIKDVGNSIGKNISVHTLRHTNATQLLKSGVDIFKIKELLGHSNIATTQMYLSLDSKDKEQAIESLTF